MAQLRELTADKQQAGREESRRATPAPMPNSSTESC